MPKSIEIQVLDRIKRNPRGTLFFVDSFVAVGNAKAVKKCIVDAAVFYQIPNFPNTVWKIRKAFLVAYQQVVIRFRKELVIKHLTTIRKLLVMASRFGRDKLRPATCRQLLSCKAQIFFLLLFKCLKNT
ncbi:MAG: hypothetical protein ACKV1O_27625 [Saprospiraceae bacterium]